LHILSKAAIDLKYSFICIEESIYVRACIETVETAFILSAQVLFEAAITDPIMHLGAAPVQQLLNLGKELRTGPVTEAGGDECESLLVQGSIHLMHEPGRVSLYELRCLIQRGPFL
jgi:hypothetical protein